MDSESLIKSVIEIDASILVLSDGLSQTVLVISEQRKQKVGFWSDSFVYIADSLVLTRVCVCVWSERLPSRGKNAIK